MSEGQNEIDYLKHSVMPGAQRKYSNNSSNGGDEF